MQYNKRDLPKVHSVEELEQALNPQAVPYFEAAAATGRGVYETLHAVSSALFQRLVHELRPNAPNVGATAATSPARVTAQAATPAPVGAPRASTAAAGQATAPSSSPRHASGPGPSRPTQVEPNTLDLPEVGVDTVAPNRQSEVVANATAKRFGVPAGNVPSEPTSEQILSSLEGSPSLTQVGAPRREEPALEIEKEKEFSEFGHTIDLALEPQEPEGGDPGFIKDPLQKPPAAPASAAGETAEAAPAVPQAKTLHIPVTVSAQDLAPGTTLRLILDVRVDR
jgi:hypothetical protein